uniref:Tryptophyllin-T3-2 n=1 Tax=Phasmahyla jandaia TaxID=762504 RepID=TY32_PHAJA|nr:RecName: Full=Tryptophyllin-T3-2; Short=Pj-T3-2 [Phasmahyla jandaia]
QDKPFWSPPIYPH